MHISDWISEVCSSDLRPRPSSTPRRWSRPVTGVGHACVMRHVTDEERRARLATRHRIMPGARAVDAVAATRAMTVLHATEPPTVHLSLAARVEDLTREDIDRELYQIGRAPV